MGTLFLPTWKLGRWGYNLEFLWKCGPFSRLAVGGFSLAQNGQLPNVQSLLKSLEVSGMHWAAEGAAGPLCGWGSLRWLQTCSGKCWGEAVLWGPSTSSALPRVSELCDS